MTYFACSRIAAPGLVVLGLLSASPARAGETPPKPFPAPAPAERAAPLPAAAPARPTTTTTTSAVIETPEHAVSDTRQPDTRFSGAALVGFGTDHLNFGIGVRFGKTLGNHVYVGGTFVYHLGDSQTVTATAGTTTASGNASFSAFYVGPEGGYDLVLGPTTVRPYVGLGLASLKVSASGGGASASSSDTTFVIWPGATVIYEVPESPWFVGGDARLVTIPGGPAFGIVAFGGMHFGS